MFIRLFIKSKNKYSLIKFLQVFKNFINNKELKLNKTLVFSQRQKINKVFSILKSIHVNKTAQEQFEFDLFSKNIKIHTFQILKLLIILKKIETNFFSDIQIRVKLLINKKYKKEITKQNLNIGKISLNPLQDFKQIKLYLSIFNYLGKYNLLKNV